uniref:spore coat protein U domain-containing protein n=1 Tax=Candidatus Electronema sp. TaxID=2698783 RepID=UPI0040565D46
MKQQILSLAAAAAVITAASSSFAAPPPIKGALSYSMDLVDACTAATITGVTFPAQTTSAVDNVLDSQGAGSINVTCPAAYTVCVAKGNSAVVGKRGLVGLSHTLDYVLSSGAGEVGDSGCNALGVAAQDTATWASPLTGVVGVTEHPLTAVITIAGGATAGTYTDMVPVNVVW